MLEPSKSSGSLELPDCLDDSQFDCVAQIPSEIVTDHLLSDADGTEKQCGTAAVESEWLADSMDDKHSFCDLHDDALIQINDALMSENPDEMMASSGTASAAVEDDLDADSKSVFTVHEIGNPDGSHIISNSDFELDDSIIQESLQVDPSLISKQFIEPSAESRSSDVSSAPSELFVSPQQPIPAMATKRKPGRRKRVLAVEEPLVDSGNAGEKETLVAISPPIVSPIRSHDDKPANTGSQPRRSVRISEHDPRDFAEEIRQGHHIKMRTTGHASASPVKSAAGIVKKQAAGDDIDDNNAVVASPCKALAWPSSKAEVDVQNSPTPAKPSKKRSAAVIEVVSPNSVSLSKAKTPVKKKTSTATIPDDGSSSSSDDPDSVPLLKIKQQLLVGRASAPSTPGDNLPTNTPAQGKLNVAAPAKKKRGRPRKNPLPESQKQEVTGSQMKTLPTSANAATNGGVSTKKKKKKLLQFDGSNQTKGADDSSLKKAKKKHAITASSEQPQRDTVQKSLAPTNSEEGHEVTAGTQITHAKLLPADGSSSKQAVIAKTDAIATLKMAAGKADVTTSPKTGTLKHHDGSDESATLSKKHKIASQSASSNKAASALAQPVAGVGKPPKHNEPGGTGQVVKSVVKMTPGKSHDQGNSGQGAAVVKRPVGRPQLSVKATTGVPVADSGNSKRLPPADINGGSRAEADVPAKKIRLASSEGGNSGRDQGSQDKVGGTKSIKMEIQGEEKMTKREEEINNKPAAPESEELADDLNFVDDSEDDDEWDEENDPDRTWCICHKPHDNRFMICCDRCQEWYHGDCVGVSRARGKEMEANGEEYVCITCREIEIVNRLRLSSDSMRLERMKERELKDAGDEPTKALSAARKENIKSPRAVGSSSAGDGEADEGTVTGTTKRRRFKKFKTKPPPQSCIVTGCARLAEAGTVYCGEICIRRYAQQMQQLIDSKSEDMQRLKAALAAKARAEVAPADAVIVLERHTGTVIAGSRAPRRQALVGFLLKHRSFEVLQPGGSNQLLAKSRTATASSSKFYPKDKGKEAGGKDRKPSTSAVSSTAPTPSRQNSGGVVASVASEHPAPDQATIRSNVRKTLKDLLLKRMKEAEDVDVSESEVQNVVATIERELFSYYGDTGLKYKARYRSLLFNIKDPKNKGLFRKIVKNRIKASKLVRMTPDELASKELMQWREHEMKHEINRIKELEELRAQEEVPRVLQVSHKQELELLNDDLSSLREVILEEKPKDMNLDVKTKNVNLEAAMAKTAAQEADAAAALAVADTTAMHGSHLFDLNCKICTGKQSPVQPAASASAAKKQAKVDHRVHMAISSAERPRVQLSAQPPEVVDRVVAREMRHLGKELAGMKRTDAELQRRTAAAAAAEAAAAAAQSPPAEPTSTVESPRPQSDSSATDIATSTPFPKSAVQANVQPAPMWKGSLSAPEVTKFFAAAHAVAGPAENVKTDLPDALNIVGRITPDQIWSYLSQLKHSATRDVVVLRLSPLTDDEITGYTEYYNYLSSKKRCGVVGNLAKSVKDMYVIPLSAQSSAPSQLMQYCLNGKPGLPDSRSHTLIAVMVRSKGAKKPFADTAASRQKKPQKAGDRKKGADGSTPPVTADNELSTGAYEPYDPETPATDYQWKAALPAVSSSMTATSSDPIIKAYARPDPRTLAAQDAPGASPYSPTQSDGIEDEAYDPADDVALPTATGSSLLSTPVAASASEPSQQQLLLLKLTKQVEDQRLQLEMSKARLNPAVGGGVSTPAASALPQAIQDIMTGKLLFAASSGGSDPSKPVGVLEYLRQTLEKTKALTQPGAGTSAAAAAMAVAPSGLSSVLSTSATFQAAEPAAATAHPLSSAFTMASASTMHSLVSLRPVLQAAARQPPPQVYRLAALPKGTTVIPGLGEHVPLPDVAIPGLGDDEWATPHGGHSPYLLDERDYDERQNLVSSPPNNLATASPRSSSLPSHRAPEEFQDFDYRSLPHREAAVSSTAPRSSHQNESEGDNLADVDWRSHPPQRSAWPAQGERAQQSWQSGRSYHGNQSSRRTAR